MNFFFSKIVERGSPVFLNGLLHEKYDKSLVDVGPNYGWYWAEPGKRLDKLPETLTLITKDPLINFDIRSGEQANDFYVSSDLLAAIQEVTKLDCSIARLSVVGRDGCRRSERDYSYIRLAARHRLSRDSIDFDKSIIEYRKQGEIKRISSLTLKDSICDHLFMIDEIKIFGHLFISEHLANVLGKRKWCGFSLFASQEIGAHKSV
jgi:hypothetical protein